MLLAGLQTLTWGAVVGARTLSGTWTIVRMPDLICPRDAIFVAA
jgi:hypothetical protein